MGAPGGPPGSAEIVRGIVRCLSGCLLRFRGSPGLDWMWDSMYSGVALAEECRRYSAY